MFFREIGCLERGMTASWFRAPEPLVLRLFFKAPLWFGRGGGRLAPDCEKGMVSGRMDELNPV